MFPFQTTEICFNTVFYSLFFSYSRLKYFVIRISNQNSTNSFQEVVPLSAGNVLGAETRMPIPKWEAIIRKSLNKSPEPEPIPKSYSAPTSPVSEIVSHADLMSSKTTTDSQRRFYSLDWPEYALDVKQKDVCLSGKNLRRVLSSSDRVRNDWFTNPTDFGPIGNVVNHGELKRVRRSSGDLGLLWTQQREKADVVGLLYDVFEQVSEDEEDDDDSLIDTTDVQNKPIQSGKKFHKYEICNTLFFSLYVYNISFTG